MNATPETASSSDSEEELVGRLERLIGELELISDPSARGRAEELISAVIELYGDGLERILALVDDAGPAAAGLRDRLAGDGVVASLMLIHGLYPVSLEQRVVEALDGVRPYMESHGGDVELLGLEGGIARIRLVGSCDGCPASASTLELAIKTALDEAAPDLEGLVVEGIGDASPSSVGPGAMELPVVQVAPGGAEAPPSWFEVDLLVTEVGEGELTTADVNGQSLVVARVEGALLAFLDACADCRSSLAGGELAEGALACPECGRAYFLPRAGRSLDDDRLLLAPVPLLAGAGGARVALA